MQETKTPKEDDGMDTLLQTTGKFSQAWKKSVTKVMSERDFRHIHKPSKKSSIFNICNFIDYGDSACPPKKRVASFINNTVSVAKYNITL